MLQRVRTPTLSVVGFLLALGSPPGSASALPLPHAPSALASVLQQNPAPVDLLERLRADPRVEEALRRIEESDEQTMAALRELTEIPAPPFMEDERGGRFLEMLRAVGVDSAWVDAEGNVLGLRRGSGGGEVLALTGHLDTVFPEGTDVTIRQRGDTLFAPGVADDTRGLATILTVLRVMNEADIRTEGDLLVVGTVGEEGLGDLRGVKHLFREDGPRIDAFVSIDGTSDDRIVHEALGSHRYRVTVEGPGGHSWGAFGLPNPAHALGSAIRAFDLAADAFTRTGARTSYNVGRIGGGTSVNSIPFEAWMEIDMRSEVQARLLQVDSVFQHALRRSIASYNAARREGPPLELRIEMIGNRPSGSIAVDDPLIQRAAAATRAFGMEPRMTRSSGQLTR